MKIYLSHGAQESATVSDISRKFGLIPIPEETVFEKAMPSACVSGGEISEYLQSLARKGKTREIFIPRLIRRFAMPAETADGEDIPLTELSALLWQTDAKSFYSPQMMLNYSVFRDAASEIGFVLFDDARSISEKLRLAKRLGFEKAILAYRSIFDIIGDIMF